MRLVRLDFALRNRRQLEQVLQKPDLEGLIAVYRNGQANDAAFLTVDVMAAVDA